MSGKRTSSGDQFGRETTISQALGLPFAVTAAVALVGALLVEDKQEPFVLAGCAVVALAWALWLGRRWWKQSEPERTEEVWFEAVREQMKELWVNQALAGSAEKLRRDFSAASDSSWLHPKFRDAVSLEDGTVIDLAESDAAPGNEIGELFNKLNGSFLLVGEAGSGKSVALWQTLDYLLTHTNHNVLLLEVFRWAEFDHGQTKPDFAAFVSWALQDPNLGTPPDVAALLVPEFVLLLDGLDELADTDMDLAVRFLESLDRATMNNQLHRFRVLTTRPERYRDLDQRQGVGIRSVTNSVVLQPYAMATVMDALSGEYPRLDNLKDTLEGCETLRGLACHPLWLSLLVDIHHNDMNSRPLKDHSTVSEREYKRLIYQEWLAIQATDRSLKWKTQAGFLAQQMKLRGIQTLRLEEVTPSWFSTATRPQQFAVTSLLTLMSGLSSGLTLGIIGGLVVGLPFGLTLGIIGGLVGGLSDGLSGEFGQRPLRARQTFSLRHLQFNMSSRLGGGLIGGISGGLILGLGIGPVIGLSVGLGVGLTFGLIGGIGNGLNHAFVPRPQNRPYKKPTEAIRTDAKLSLTRNLLTGGVIGGVIIGLILVMSGGLITELTLGLSLGLSAGLTFGLVGGLSVGFGAGMVNSVLGNFLKALALASVTGLLPWRIVSFLNELRTTKLMYRVGAGFRFQHRTLTDHIAQEWNQN